MPRPEGAVPLLVKVYEGMPNKLNPNPNHPQGVNGLDHYTQASILDLYDPTRAKDYKKDDAPVAAENAIAYLTQIAAEKKIIGGKGLCFLLDSSPSPTRNRIISDLKAVFPNATWLINDPLNFQTAAKASKMMFGRALTPYYHIDKSKTILSLDGDILGGEPDFYRHINAFSKARSPDNGGAMCRLYVCESALSLTGVNADHRLTITSRDISYIAARVLLALNDCLKAPEAMTPLMKALTRYAETHFVLNAHSITSDADADYIDHWINVCTDDLISNISRSLVVTGYKQPVMVHGIVAAINLLLDNTNVTVDYNDILESVRSPLHQLNNLVNSGDVDTLIVSGGHSNPVFSHPDDDLWKRLRQANVNVLRLGYYEDETFDITNWHYPAAHYLESWGDAFSSDGNITPLQPMVQPLFNGMSESVFLSRLAGTRNVSDYDIVKNSFSEYVHGGSIESAWRGFLKKGWLNISHRRSTDLNLYTDDLIQLINRESATHTTATGCELVIKRSFHTDDGRSRNNLWLSELSEPITKLTWRNAYILGVGQADALGLKNGDIVEVEAGDLKVQGPVLIEPNTSPSTICVACGHGCVSNNTMIKNDAINPYPLKPNYEENVCNNVTMRKLSGRINLPLTQEYFDYNDNEPDPFVDLSKLRISAIHKDDERICHNNTNAESPQWGMVVDLNRCVGCSSCMIACRNENNIPIVGADEVRKGRVMDWMRVHRYVITRRQKSKANDTVVNIMLPVMCQHCENAPCEYVCPVNATVHDKEGLNVMVYNKCIGARYCANNCPYEARRFNFYNYHEYYYNKSLYKKPVMNEWNMQESKRALNNADVTLRKRGIMEKCTYCIQRISDYSIKDRISDSSSKSQNNKVTTACQDACPANAISFGNISDNNDEVAILKQDKRNINILDCVNTQPRTSYLIKVLNHNDKISNLSNV
ncbi:MAG: 4Fe-4S dicluster domain-containing protein [Verrucomicrobia bacterium]|nr:4Fe-4S dicluster domain-containing protein [Verrucomicrobiota bacterium]